MNTTKEFEALTEKIQKLLALSKSPNENEAMSAATKVQELLIKYNLSMEDIKPEEMKSQVQEDWIPSLFNKTNLWEKVILKYTCFAYMTFPLLSGERDLVIVGLPADVEASKQVYLYLRKAILDTASLKTKEYDIDFRSKYGKSAYHAKGALNAENYRISFIMSATESIKSRLIELANSMKEISDNTAIVLVREEVISDYLSKYELKPQKVARQSTHNQRGVRDGKKYGEEVSLSPTKGELSDG